MKSHLLLERISIDPRVCFGKPTVRGTRIWVSLILDLLAGDMTLTGTLGRSIHSSRRRTFLSRHRLWRRNVAVKRYAVSPIEMPA